MTNKPPQNTDWEREFDKNFWPFIKEWQSTRGSIIYTDTGTVTKRSLKSFIQSEKDLSYQQGREDMRKEILEGMPLFKTASSELHLSQYSFMLIR